MKKLLMCVLPLLLLMVFSREIFAQKHLAIGEEVIRGNRLMSVKVEHGKQLYTPGRFFKEISIDIDGEMSESDWDNAQELSSFTNESGTSDATSVRILYDREQIYLFWSVNEKDGITIAMEEEDGIITSDDYVKIDLKPWLPDNITHGRDYSYSIAVNPAGEVWDAYMDPYLDGFYFSSWDSNTEIATERVGDQWTVEMAIPYSGIDIYSNPGWKWNLEFYHAAYVMGETIITTPNMGVTVQQDVMVRQPGLVSYYWPRPDFMQEVKPDLSQQPNKYAQVAPLSAIPEINNHEDEDVWKIAKSLPINHTDKMGEVLESNTASASIGIRENILSFNLKADGAKIEKGGNAAEELGAGMAGQMAGVNGVFVDQALFQNECFWIVLQPRDIHADDIHQDYYIVIVDNRGGVSGTHYDKYGAPFRIWQPRAEVDLYNTSTGWGAEVNLDLNSLALTADYGATWGINVFRNRLIDGEGDSELQAWKYTANDFLNPEKFGELSGITTQNIALIRSNIEQQIKQTEAQLSEYGREHRSVIRHLDRELNSLETGSLDELRAAGAGVQHINHQLGILDASIYYDSVPHPTVDGYPLMDIQFIGEYGWAVGAMGTIIRTENGGETWDKVSLKSDADLYRVDFVNEKEGWAAGGRIRIADTNESMRHDKRGGYGYIYHTEDGGKTWECQFGERGRHLFGLDFVNEDIGYAIGERGYLLKTVDGGETWKMMPTTGTMNWLYGVAFLDEQTGFAVGLYETVIKTTDGGATWEEVNARADKEFYDFRAIYRDITFYGDTGCIVGQNGTLLMSYDSGNTWEPGATFYKDEIRELMDLRSVQFVNSETGFAVGEMGSKILMTSDGGENWQFVSTNSTEWLRSVWADGDGRLYVTGERDKILASDDHGKNWRIQNGKKTKIDILVMMAHGDDAAIHLNPFFAHYAINEGKDIVDLGAMSDVHSSEYEETYNLEHDRNVWMIGVGTSTNFNEFETGNNGANYYHYNQRLWEGESNITRHMVAAIRAYRPDIVITHGGVFGDYDKPGHKASGRAGLPAFNTAGGDVDYWPELTRLGLAPWQAKKLYHLASESYPGTVDLSWIGEQPLKGTNMTCEEFGEYVIRNFQSQGVYHVRDSELSLVKSHVPVPDEEKSVFDGLE